MSGVSLYRFIGDADWSGKWIVLSYVIVKSADWCLIQILIIMACCLLPVLTHVPCTAINPSACRTSIFFRINARHLSRFDLRIININGCDWVLKYWSSALFATIECSCMLYVRIMGHGCLALDHIRTPSSCTSVRYHAIYMYIVDTLCKCFLYGTYSSDPRSHIS